MSVRLDAGTFVAPDCSDDDCESDGVEKRTLDSDMISWRAKRDSSWGCCGAGLGWGWVGWVCVGWGWDGVGWDEVGWDGVGCDEEEWYDGGCDGPGAGAMAGGRDGTGVPDLTRGVTEPLSVRRRRFRS